ncbi:hypothetical protein [Chromobacterium vaccinii]|uniref:hypothetical protein n=1 Tax=Chromobacterium vaccinii TaxID=1108595 RepID=UPI003C7933DB
MIGGGIAAVFVVVAIAAPANNGRAYSVLRDGEKAFQDHHALAPNAVFRYRLFLQDARVKAADLGLSAVAGGWRQGIELDRRQAFALPTLPRERAAAEVIAAPAVQSLNWRPEVLTPGGAAGSRRLGDLRLECLVDAQSHLNNLDGEKLDCAPKSAEQVTCIDDMKTCARYAPAAVGQVIWNGIKNLAQLKVDADPYSEKSFSYLFIADRPVFSITLQQGNRRQVLPTSWLYGSPLGRSPFFAWPYPKEYFYSLPLGDASWSNDALVVFEYMKAAE